MSNGIWKVCILGFMLSINILYFRLAWSEDLHSGHSMEHTDAMDHSVHMAMMQKPQERSVENYSLPQVRLVNQDGLEKDLNKVLVSDKLVVVDFIFTTCTTICPVLSAGLTSFHKQLGDKSDNVALISITIDPEHDNPEILKAYSQKYNMKSGHELLTGNKQDINSVMKAFDADMPNKMTHYPLTFFRAPGKQEWVRVFGLMGVNDLMKEYDNLMKS